MKRLIISILFTVLIGCCTYAQEYRDLVADMTESHLASINHENWKQVIAKKVIEEKQDTPYEKAEKLAEQYLGERYNQVIISIMTPRFEKIMTFEELESWNEVWLQTEIIRVNQMINDCLCSQELLDAINADRKKMTKKGKDSVKLECSIALYEATVEYLNVSGYSDYREETAAIHVANAFYKNGITEELLEEMKTVTAFPEYGKMQREVSIVLGDADTIAKALDEDLRQWLRDH